MERRWQVHVPGLQCAKPNRGASAKSWRECKVTGHRMHLEPRREEELSSAWHTQVPTQGEIGFVSSNLISSDHFSFLELFWLREKKNLIAFDKSTRRRPDEERATRGSSLPKRTGHHVPRHFQWFLHDCHSSRIFSPSDRSRSAHSWSACVCRWGTERLRVSGHLESRSAKTLSLLSHSRDPYLYPRPGAVAVLWKSREKLVTEGGKSPRHGHGGQKARADYSLCGSLGDASVNARAMSRRKQGNPQHLSQREIITRKSIFYFTCLCLSGCSVIFGHLF